MGVLRIEDGNHGEYRPRPEEFTPEGIAYIRAADMTSGTIDFSGAGKINAGAYRRIRKGIGRPGDVILSHKGTVGRVAVAPKDSPEYVCSPQTTFWRSLDPGTLDQGYLRYLMTSPKFVAQLDYLKSQTDMAPYVSLTDQRALTLEIPTISAQKAIAEVLGALDDKIAANAQAVQTSADLGLALLLRAVAHGSDERPLSELTVLVTRGITPSYTNDSDGTLVLNQKCVRGQRVDVRPGRQTAVTRTRSEKMLIHDDVLVNSTGQGTLGRVARWTGTKSVTVDSHITIIRFDPRLVNLVCAGYAVLSMQDEIEAMGEGSTGQTELSRTELAKLLVKLPIRSEQDRLGASLNALSDAEDSFLRENAGLAATRDTLLPALMSGKLRVKDAEKQLEEVL